MGGGGALTPDSRRSCGGAGAFCSSSSRGRYDTCAAVIRPCCRQLNGPVNLVARATAACSSVDEQAAVVPDSAASGWYQRC